MATIRPITDMRKTNEFSELCHTSHEPVFVTKNGREDLVVMSVEAYEQEQALMDIYRKLGDAEQQVIDGIEPLDAQIVLGKLRDKYGYE